MVPDEIVDGILAVPVTDPFLPGSFAEVHGTRTFDAGTVHSATSLRLFPSILAYYSGSSYCTLCGELGRFGVKGVDSLSLLTSSVK